MMEKRPLVSVIMPAYEAEKTIEESIHSVLNQTYSNFELIVIDDGSKDCTINLVERLMEKDTRIRLIKNEKNLGVAMTRNKGFDSVGGQYVALLDSDDIWHPEKLERQVNLAILKHADIVYCGYSMVDENGKKLCDDFLVPETTSFKDTLIKSVISCSTALLSKNVTDTYRFSTDYYHEDYVFWLQILKDGKKACGLKEPLASYRLVEGSRASNKWNAAVHRWKIYRSFLGYSFLKSTWITVQYAALGVLKYRRH